MIKISENLFLRAITSNDAEILFKLMKEVYPAAYHHFWEDSGNWYVNTQYTKENVLKELKQLNADYYFVIFNDEIMGNLRIIWDEQLTGLQKEKQVKLHRVYLHKKIQGKGIGKQLFNWLETEVLKKGYKIIWLETMNAQPQAFEFYKKLGFKYHSHNFLPFNLMFKEMRKISQVYKNLDKITL
ncbi:N-acetyltransferase [Polaribacter reichenbachii]|uniref:GNAT family acetyltransferase n=1 Tax=Polaribacter reichenbachii TaxID=996801 RepID=A0A1B8TUJ7_9FLAO|nr:GNAT family N-acetyltransferase [Polaribacter reichenbachii]APZ45715.1 N-acetyltransferase [Polaribacter reichenbachii]AUC19576.1 N-acetyltransferase [Polaribacter reichenbachii]OBY63270.1 GNAT family acetyltransferase [Polaribacter reichenbachii]